MKQLDNEESVRKILSLEKVDHLLVDTLCNLKEGGVDSWEYIAGKCFGHTNIETIAQVIKAVTASTPYYAEKWLDILIDPIRVFLKFPEHHPETEVGADYVLGLIEGVFSASNWYDESYHRGSFMTESPMVEKFDFLVKYFLDRNPIAVMADERLITDNKFAEKYESRLSQLIKAFVRCKNSRGARMKSVVTLAQLAHAKIKKLKLDDKKTSKLGSIIFDQIGYAAFGSLSTSGRMRAVVALNNDLLQFPTKKE